MSDWLEDTHKKLIALPRKITFTQIAAETGLKIGWISAFSRKEIPDPGIRKVQTLNTYLENFKGL